MNKKLILFMTSLSLLAAPISAFANEYNGPVATMEAIEDRAALRAATGEYRTWKQYDSRWRDMHLGTSSDDMNNSGCLVTAIATLMVHSGSADEAGVNPGKLCTYLNENGGFTSYGELYWDKINGAVEGFSVSNYKVLLSGSRYDKMAQIKSYIDRGYYIIVSVGHGAHWVAVDSMTSDGTNIKIFDPAYSYSTLFGSYSDAGIDRIAIFASTGNGNGNIDVEDPSIENYSAKGKVNVGASYLNVRAGVGTDKDYLTTNAGNRVTLQNGAEVTITGKGKDSSGNLWYRINIDGLVGYVFAAYIEISDSNEIETPTEPGKPGEVNTYYVNIRSGAGTAYSVIAVANKGEALEIYEEKTDSAGNKWYKVKYKDDMGYIHSDYVTLETETENGDEITYDKEKAAKVNASSVNVRKDAGTGNTVVKTLALNTALKAVGEKKDSNGAVWYKVTFDGGKGYIHSDYVTITDEEAEQPGENTPAYESKNGKVKEDYVNVRKDAGTDYSRVTSLRINTAVTIVGEKKDSDGNLWYKIKYANGEGYMRSDFITVENSENSGNNNSNNSYEKKYGKVNQNSVNVRSGAGTNNGIVGNLSSGTAVTIVGEAKDGSGTVWYQIEYSGGKGYMHSDYITVDGANNNNNNNNSSYQKKSGKVNANSVNVRSDAGTGNGVVGNLSSGTAVTIIGEKKDSSGAKWYQIEYTGGKGYMHSDYITITDGSSNGSETETPNNTPTYTAKAGKVNDDYVNVRSGAGTNHSRVTSLRANTAVTIVGEAKDSDGATWYKIQYANGEGYMRSDFITINGSDNSSNAGTNTGNSGTTNGSTNQNYPMEGIEGKEGIVSANIVNVRKDANGNAEVVTTIEKGVSVLIEGATKDSSGVIWYKIGFAGTTGYMMAQYITIQ